MREFSRRSSHWVAMAALWLAACAPQPHVAARSAEITEGQLVGDVEAMETAASPSLGPADAPVVLVGFQDFECPSCARWYASLRPLLEQRAGHVRFVFKHLPLPDHPHARGAAAAAEAARAQGKFWEMAELLFAHQAHLGADDLRSYAQRLALDLGQFDRDSRSDAVNKRIDADFHEAERFIATRPNPGAPAFFVNGRRAAVRNPSQLTRLLDDAASRTASSGEGELPAPSTFALQR